MSSNLDHHLEALAADPQNSQALQALEEGYFLAGAWQKLVDLYDQQLAAATDLAPKQRASLLHRAGQVLEERCLDSDLAVERYTQAITVDPTFRPALQQLRRIHSEQGAWDLVLQIGEVENGAPMAPYERAEFLAEMGEVWLTQLTEPTEAMSCFEQALGIDPHHKRALAGLAGTLEITAQPEAAAAAWHRLIGLLRGPDRAAPLVALARLSEGPLNRPDQALACYARALEDDPRNEAAVEALIVAATARQQWSELAGLFEKRFSLASGAKRRTVIALEGCRLCLERLEDPETARAWVDRAQALSADDAAVYLALAELERSVGDEDSLLLALERAVELSSEEPPRSTLLELSTLYAERADDERALQHLERAQVGHPNDPLLLAALSDTLANLGRYEELANVLEQRALVADGDSELRAAMLAELGELFQGPLADPEVARDAFERSFDACPAAHGTAETLERLYRKAEEWEPLRAMLERASDEGAPDERCGSLCSLGDVLRTKFDDLDGSRTAFERALELSSDERRALDGLALLARDSGDEDALLSVYERELEGVTEIPRTIELSRALYRLYEERGACDLALTAAEHLLAVSPHDREALETMARLLDVSGGEDALLATLCRLEEQVRGTDQSAIRRRIAELHMAHGDEDLAVLSWEAALESDPEDLDSWRAIRTLYTAQGRTESLAPVLRKLANVLPQPEAMACQEELATLLEERLGDLDAAIVVVWGLAALPEPPAGCVLRLESLLERAGRFEELAQQLHERRRSLPDDSEEATALDVRRGTLLIDPLGQFEEAASVFQAARQRGVGGALANEGLERALRAANDSAGLADLLEELSAEEPDRTRALTLRLERAVLLEDDLDREDDARAEYESLADTEEVTDEAARDLCTRAAVRLERLLERSSDWASLRTRLEASVLTASAENAKALHERIAFLCRDRVQDDEAAAEHFEAAGRIDPTQRELWQHLGGIYEALGRPDDLLRVIEAELAAEPTPDREPLLHARAASLWSQQDEGESNATAHYERLLELVPGHAEATEFLAVHYEKLGRPSEVERLLVERLASLGDRSDLELTASAHDAQQSDSDNELRTSLALRISMLRSEELDDLSGAIQALEPAVERDGPLGPATAPLADLYRLAGCEHELIALYENAAGACFDDGERVLWLLRLGEELKESGDTARAAAAYQDALERSRDPREPEEALCDLYRTTGQADALAALLERVLERESLRGYSIEESEIRMELAGLYEDALARPDDAFSQLEQIVSKEPGHTVALERILALASRLGRHDDQQRLIDAQLERSTRTSERAALLEHRADLMAGPMDASEQAIATYREVLTLDPGRRSARESLRTVLEGLSRFSAVLDCLHVDATEASGEERIAIFERAVEIATEKVGPDASLPWLERLRAERPTDPEIVSRIADVHRLAGRFESVLRAINDELAIGPAPSRARELHLGRALIFERDMAAPTRAVAALEAALELAPEDAAILEKLDALYEGSGRNRDRVGILERRIACEDGERLPLHCAAAAIYCNELAEPAGAVPHLLHAVAMSDGAPTQQKVDRIEALGKALRAVDDPIGWARATEAHLAILEAPPTDLGPDAAARVNPLRGELATAYLTELRDSRAALGHLRRITDSCGAEGEAPAGLEREAFLSLEQSMLDLLRTEHNPVELAARLANRLERTAGTCEEWLELARLCDEQLHAPTNARDAYRRALSRDPLSIQAIRGIGQVSELLSDWDGAAEAIDLELALPGRSGPRAALFRKLGGICWQRLADTDRAIRAYESALEADENDLVSLRCLEQLHERREDWSLAASHYEREVELLGDRDPERRLAAWLAVADIACTRASDPARALHAYEQASALTALAPELLYAQALLYRELGNEERHLEVYAAWCDDPSQPAACGEQLALVEALHAADRQNDARERAIRVTEANPLDARPWQALAMLHELAGDLALAGDAFERAGTLHAGSKATEHFISSALLVEQSDPGCALERLRRAVESDPASIAAHAHLARTANACERFTEATTAAGRSLDLSSAAGSPPEVVRTGPTELETALIGGRAARASDQLDTATLFYAAAIEIDRDHCEALDAQSQLLFERGDLDGARTATEKRLAIEVETEAEAEAETAAEAGAVAVADRLTRLGMIHELQGDDDSALTHFERALAACPSDGAAHAGRTRIHVKAGRIPASVAALDTWAELERASGNLTRYAERLLQAAELEIGDDRTRPAEAHLHCALGADPESPRSWVLLAELLSEQGRTEDLLRIAPAALTFEAVTRADDAVARLALLHARALVRRRSPELACEAYGLARERDDRCAEAALGEARLLRRRGAWSEAAQLLEAFASGHPQPGHRDLAEVHCKLADLLAGPLEDVDGAIRSYERALEIWPEHPRAREPLATLLGHLPDRQAEAVRHHSLLLEWEPMRSGSIRALAGIAAARGDLASSAFGLALLRGLGAASPAERHRADATLTPLLARGGSDGPHDTFGLEDPLWEAARKMTHLASEVLEAMPPESREGEPESVPEGAQQDAYRTSTWLSDPTRTDAFSDAFARALGELSAPSLTTLEDEALCDVLFQIAVAACGDEADSSTEADAGSALRLGRWTRRKVRRALDDVTPEDVRAIDAGAWRDALHGLVAERALESLGGDLRAALTSLAHRERPIGDSDDLTALLSADPLACELLRRLERRWCQHLSRT